MGFIDLQDHERELARKDAELEALNALVMTQDAPDEVKRLQDELASMRAELKDAEQDIKDMQSFESQEALEAAREKAEAEEEHNARIDAIGAAVEDLLMSLGLPRRPVLINWPEVQRLIDLVQL